MTTRADPTAVRPHQVPVRLAYALGVMLDASDFFAEQSYQRGRLSRALKYLFGTGTVAGLRVIWRPADLELVVEPGLAIDPLGRLVEVSRTVAIRLTGGAGSGASWFTAQDLATLSSIPGAPPVLVADVFLRFVSCEKSLTPAVKTGPYEAIDAAFPTRLGDGYEVALVARSDLGASPPATIPVPDDVSILAGRPANPVDALQWAKSRILDAWRDGTDQWTGTPPNERPHRLLEHLPPDSEPVPNDPREVGKDPTSVLLARVSIPLEDVSPPDDPDFPFTISLTDPPAIDNGIRRIVRGPSNTEAHVGIYTQPDVP